MAYSPAAMGDITDNLDLPFQILTGLLILLVLLALWSSATRLRPDEVLPHWTGRGVKNLFLSFRLHLPGGDARGDSAHLMALTLNSAVFVSSRRLARGERVQLDAGSLPGFPESSPNAMMEADVRSCRSLGGDPATYLVSVRFLPHQAEVRDLLGTYIRQLSGTASEGRFSHA